MRPAIADTGSDVDGWFVGAVVLITFVVWAVVEVRKVRRERLSIPRVDRPLVEPIPELPRRARLCSYIGCDEDPVVAVNGWLVCQTHRPRTAVTTKENRTMAKPAEIHVDAEGESVTIRPKDLPAVANVREFTAALSFEDVEDLYVRMRSRRLGVGGGGDL